LKGEFVDRISAYLPQPLTTSEKELLKKDIHGGWWETSMMLLLRPDLVKEISRSLPSTQRKSPGMEADPGYWGSPSLATPGFAEASLRVMTEEGASIMERCLAGDDVRSMTIAPLYRILPLRPYFVRYAVASLSILILLAIIAIVLLTS
jgi:hypothetical protein